MNKTKKVQSVPLHSRLATDKTRYVTSSYILCHIIIHAISHHQTECAPAFSAGNRSKGLLVPKGGEEKKKRRKRKRRKKKKEKKLCLCILGLEALDVLLELCQLWAEGGVDVVELLLLLFYLVR